MMYTKQVYTQADGTYHVFPRVKFRMYIGPSLKFHKYCFEVVTKIGSRVTVRSFYFRKIT